MTRKLIQTPPFSFADTRDHEEVDLAEVAVALQDLAQGHDIAEESKI